MILLPRLPMTRRIRSHPSPTKEGKLRTNRTKALVWFFCSLVLFVPAFAQKQTGNLDGTILDANSAPLPGVTVTIASPALMGKKSYISSERGAFRFPALSPGVYEVAAELAGFKTVKREGLIVSVGRTTTITITMEQTTLSEEVTVTAAPPVVDVKSSTLSVNYTKELLQNIPTNRDLFAVISTAPGAVDIGYLTTVHGGTYAQNIYSLDGLNITDPLVGIPTTAPDLGMIEELEMQVGAHPADVGSAGGAYINVVTKSGGNAFHGDATVFYFNENFVDKNVSQEQLDALGLSTSGKDKLQSDFALSLGGPVIKDRLWFFAAGRRYFQNQTLTGFDHDIEEGQWYGMAKLTAQLAKNVKLMGYYNLRTRDIPVGIDFDPRTATLESSYQFTMKSKNLNTQLSWVLGPNAFLDVRGMWAEHFYDYRYQPGATHWSQDNLTGIITGAYYWQEYLRKVRYFSSAALTFFVDDFLGGNHELKVGGEIDFTQMRDDVWTPDPINEYTLGGSPYSIEPYVGLFMAIGSGPNEGEGEFKIDTRSLNFYIQDNWTIMNRLTLNLGLRYDASSASLPAQYAEEVPAWLWLDPVYFARHDYSKVDNLLTFNNLSPRLGLTFDIFGNRRTVAKASFSRYRDYLQQAMVYAVNPNTYSLRYYVWVDLNADALKGPEDYYINAYEMGRGTEDPRSLIDPDVKAPFWNEFIVGVDHELFANFRLGVSYIHKNNVNIYENVERNADLNWGTQYTVTDPGYDGAFGTVDDASLTVYDRTRPQEPFIQTNPKEAKRKYQALELVFEKRMSNRWQLLGSVVFSKYVGNIGAAQAQNMESAFDTPNYLINRYGRLDYDRPLIIKFQGTYQLPFGINLSGYIIHSSGAPFNRILQVWTPNSQSYVTVNAEEQGSRRQPSQNRLDLRLEKEFGIGAFGKLGVFMDVYNALNNAYLDISSDFQGIIQPDGSFIEAATWQKVSAISSPRVLKLGARFSF